MRTGWLWSDAELHTAPVIQAQEMHATAGGRWGSEEANRRLVRLRCFSGIQHHHYHSGSSDGGGWPYVWERRNERKDLTLPPRRKWDGFMDDARNSPTPKLLQLPNCSTAQSGHEQHSALLVAPRLVGWSFGFLLRSSSRWRYLSIHWDENVSEGKIRAVPFSCSARQIDR